VTQHHGNNGAAASSTADSGGWTKVPNSVIRHRAVSPTAKLVWIAMRSFEQNGKIFPSYETLATYLGLSRPPIIAAVKELEAAGLLRVERRPNRPNFYHLVGVNNVYPSDVAGVKNVDSNGDGRSKDSLPQSKDSLLPGVKNVDSTKTVRLKEQDPPQACACEEPAGDTAKPKKTAKPRPKDDLWDAIIEVTGADPATNRGHLNGVCKALRDSDPPYTGDDVRRLRAALLETQPWFREKPSDWLTPGMVKKWIHCVRIMGKKPGAKGPSGPTVEDLEEKRRRAEADLEASRLKAQARTKNSQPKGATV
jgi:hypothetical protein